jgi:hypothetical protein
VFTFHCAGCKKQHVVSGPFTRPYQATCLRCGAPIQVTRDAVQVSEDAPPSRARKTASAPALRPKKPAPPTQVAIALPPPEPAPTAARRRRWPLLAGAAAGVLLAAGSGGYLVFGLGKEPPKKAAVKKAPAAKGKPPAAEGPATARAAGTGDTGRASPPGPQSPPPGATPPAPSPPRELVSAALAADPGKFGRVRLTEVTLRDGVLTLGGVVPDAALKPEVEAAARRALREARAATVVRVEDRLRDPLALVQEAVARKFGGEVTVTAVRLDGGTLRLEGDLGKWEHLQPARETAVRALEEAGLGPIKSWENHLKKPKRDGEGRHGPPPPAREQIPPASTASAPEAGGPVGAAHAQRLAAKDRPGRGAPARPPARLP